jgi:hypothetical protein
MEFVGGSRKASGLRQKFHFHLIARLGKLSGGRFFWLKDKGSINFVFVVPPVYTQGGIPKLSGAQVAP